MAKTKPEYFAQRPALFLADEAINALTMEEEGAYRRLVDFCWLSGSVPSDARSIGRLCKIIYDNSPAIAEVKSQAIRDRLAPLFTEDPVTGEWTNPREAGMWPRRGEMLPTPRMELMRAARARGNHLTAEWVALVDALGGRCLACGADEVTKDHVVPVSCGGGNGIDNLQPLCRPCNSTKGTESTDYRPDGWRSLLGRVE
jgi:hypothetical protein